MRNNTRRDQLIECKIQVFGVAKCQKYFNRYCILTRGLTGKGDYFGKLVDLMHDYSRFTRLGGAEEIRRNRTEHMSSSSSMAGSC